MKYTFLILALYILAACNTVGMLGYIDLPTNERIYYSYVKATKGELTLLGVEGYKVKLKCDPEIFKVEGKALDSQQFGDHCDVVVNIPAEKVSQHTATGTTLWADILARIMGNAPLGIGAGVGLSNLKINAGTKIEGLPQQLLEGGD